MPSWKKDIEPLVGPPLAALIGNIWVYAFCSLPSIVVGGLIVVAYVALLIFAGGPILQAYPHFFARFLPESIVFDGTFVDATHLFSKLAGWYALAAGLWYAFNRPKRTPFFRTVLLWWMPAPLITGVGLFFERKGIFILLIADVVLFLLITLFVASNHLAAFMIDKFRPPKSA